MADKRHLILSIYRYNPEVDAKPYMKDYELEYVIKNINTDEIRELFWQEYVQAKLANNKKNRSRNQSEI